MKKKLLSFILVGILLISLTGCQCKHKWSDATCITAKQCYKCNMLEGTSLGHSFSDWKESSSYYLKGGGGYSNEKRVCLNCGYTENRRVNLVDTTSQSSETTFTKDEQKLIQYLLNSLDSFKNPSSVRVIEVYTYDKEDDEFYVELSAENSMGGTTKDLYQVRKYEIFKSMSSVESIKRMPFAFGDYCSCNVATVNNQLKEYCNKMGWE